MVLYMNSEVDGLNRDNSFTNPIDGLLYTSNSILSIGFSVWILLGSIPPKY